MDPFFWLGSQLFLITEDAISEKDLVSQSCKKSSKSVNKPLKREADGGGGGKAHWPFSPPKLLLVVKLPF